MKKIILLLLIMPTISSAQLKNTIKKAISKTPTVSAIDISNGLKEALDKGIKKQVVKLTQEDGFYKNELVKIVLPEELQKVDTRLRQIGLSSLADEGILLLNRAAEDAVKEATPIFVEAIKNMTFTDAKNIVLGQENAATNYLQSTTSVSLFASFNPVIKNSLAKVGADKIWNQIITKYNSIPLVKKINPDIVEYTTNKTLAGVYKMIAVEEKEIRTNLTSRNSDLLKKVFALQDKK